MLISLFGESCTGKTTLANKIKESLGAEIYSGKDYLRLARNENEAKSSFAKKLEAAVTGENIIYIIAEREQLVLLPKETFRILVTADMEVIKGRFAARMNGQLPPPVATMLEKKHGCFDSEEYHVHVHNGFPDADSICQKLRDYMGENDKQSTRSVR